MTDARPGDADRPVTVAVDAQGGVVVELPRETPGADGIIAKRRPNGPEVQRKLLPAGQQLSARLVLPEDDRFGVWDIYLTDRESGQQRRQRLADETRVVGTACRIGDDVIEARVGVGGAVSVRVRPLRPRIDLMSLEATGEVFRLRGRLVDIDVGAEAPPLVIISPDDGQEIVVPTQRTGDEIEATVRLRDILGPGGFAQSAVDVQVRASSDGDALVHAPVGRPAHEPGRDAFPSVRLAGEPDEIEIEAYYNIDDNLSFRRAGTEEPGPATDAPVRRPAPAVVRWYVGRQFDRIERRNAAARAAGRSPLGGNRPRVYFLLRSVYGMGGTIRTVLNTANYLAEQGYRVQVISLLRPRKRPFFRVHKRIRLVPLLDERRRGDPARLAGDDHGLRAAGRRWLWQKLDGWESILTHPYDNSFPRSSLLTDRLLVAKLQRLKPGVLVTTRAVLNVIGARFAPPGVRIVGQEHMNFSLHPHEFRAYLMANYPRLDALTVLTAGDERDYRDALRDSGVEVLKVPNGLPRMPEAVSDQSAKVVVTAGRLTRQKGFDLLVAAFAAVVEEHPEWELRIYGDGPWRDRLQRQIDDLGLTRSVHLLGRTRRVYAEMARASVFAMSSRFEGFGMVLIEAMSTGLPAVAFDCPRGPADIITPGHDGLLVPPQDVAGFAEALATVIGDETLRRSMAEAALKTAESYVMDRLGQLWEGMLGDLAAARPPSATRPQR